MLCQSPARVCNAEDDVALCGRNAESLLFEDVKPRYHHLNSKAVTVVLRSCYANPYSAYVRNMLAI